MEEEGKQRALNYGKICDILVTSHLYCDPQNHIIVSSKVKVNLSQCLIKHHVTKAYREMK
jgi:hypothetical protein